MLPDLTLLLVTATSASPTSDRVVWVGRSPGFTIHCMKMKFNLLTVIAGLAALNLSGCMVLDGKSYHNDRGDLVANDASIRYVGWYGVHPNDRHCGRVTVAAANTRQADKAQ